MFNVCLKLRAGLGDGMVERESGLIDKRSLRPKMHALCSTLQTLRWGKLKFVWRSFVYGRVRVAIMCYHREVRCFYILLLLLQLCLEVTTVRQHSNMILF